VWAPLGAVDDEQPADPGIKPALDQVIDERLHDRGVLGRSFDQGEWMFVAFSINAEGGDQHQLVADMQPVDGPAWTGQTPSTRPAVLPTVPRTGARPPTSRCRRRQ
jgi:hypothetical protein